MTVERPEEFLVWLINQLMAKSQFYGGVGSEV